MNGIERISQNKRFSKARRRIVQARFFLARAYSWISVPGMIMVILGVVYPYVQGYVNVSMPFMIIIVFIGLMIVGLIDHFFGFSKAEISFGTEQNTKLLYEIKEVMDEVKENKKKLDYLLQRSEK